MRLLRIVGVVLALVGVVTGAVVLAALRDSPARAAIGARNRATSGDADIEYFTAGPAESQRVVLLPSYGRSVSDFNELAGALHAAGHGTIAIQPRGVDGSSLPSLTIDLHVLAADTAAVLDAEDVSAPVVVIGHAFGNRVARTFATDHPDRVASLVLLAAGGGAPTPPATVRAISRALFRIWPESTRRAAIGQAFFAAGSEVPEYWLRGWYPRAGIAQARAIARTPFEEWGAGGTAPILVLEPTEDAAAAGGGEALEQRHPERVTLVRVEAAGHALLPERPEAVEWAVLGYLKSR